LSRRTIYEVWGIPPGRFVPVLKSRWGEEDFQMAHKHKRAIELRGYEEVRLKEIVVDEDEEE
jgi:hypothetical protein